MLFFAFSFMNSNTGFLSECTIMREWCLGSHTLEILRMTHHIAPDCLKPILWLGLLVGK